MALSVVQVLFWMAVVATPVWFFADALVAAVAVCALLLWMLLVQVWKTRRLEAWLSQPDWRTELTWKGVWAEIAQRVQRGRVRPAGVAVAGQIVCRHALGVGAAVNSGQHGVTSHFIAFCACWMSSSGQLCIYLSCFKALPTTRSR